MPKTKRDLLKRKIAYAHRNCDQAVEHILSVQEQFMAAHPELGAVLQTAMESIYLGQTLLERFAVAAWGSLPKNWADWEAQVPYKPKK